MEKNKGEKMIPQANSNENKSEIDMLISDGNIARDMQMYHMVKIQIAQKTLHFKNVLYLYKLPIKRGELLGKVDRSDLSEHLEVYRTCLSN